MKIKYTKHAEDKLTVLKSLGWNISRSEIKAIIEKPKWKGRSHFGQETAIGLADKNHTIRIVLGQEDDIIKVITLHISRRGRYESK